MKRRTLLTATGALFAAGAGWLALQSSSNGGATTGLVGMADAQEAGDPAAIPDMIMGEADAPIEIVEYASYTCPHCARFHEGAFKQLKENYIDTGKVKFVYREVYFDLPGLWASMVARCDGGEQRFFGISNIIYSKQGEWTASGDPAMISEELMKIGLTAGLSQETLDVCMADATQAQNLMGWFRANAERDNVTGTPSFLINGEKYSNMSYEELAAILEEKLAG